MAVTSSIAYCSERDLFDVYPQIKTSDTKTRLFNWQATGVSNRYKSPNSGLVTQLFSSGNDLGSAESSASNVSSNDQWFYDSNDFLHEKNIELFKQHSSTLIKIKRLRTVVYT